jgi:D-sedoheptulose 7-phosphate isomerase
MPNPANQIASQIIDAFRQNHKLLICGNGGSAAEAQHFAAELVCRFERDRRALPALALSTDSSILTAWSNDNPKGFEEIFSRQIEALGQPGDVLITLSTSGKSKNCLRAEATAKKQKMIVIPFPRLGSGTAAIQEYQLKLIHQICRLVEKAF